ncbi:MAG: AEC family transporter [bacterium]
MTALIWLVLYFALGILGRRSGRLPDSTASFLNALVIDVCLPAVVLAQVPKLSFDRGLLFPVLMPWIFFAFGAFFFWGAGRVLRLPTKTLGCLILVAGMGNTSFVGFPLIEAFYGKEHLSTGVMVDQPGSFLLLATVGVFTALAFSSGKWSGKLLLKKVFLFPPFVALLLALALLPFSYPAWVQSLLSFLGSLLSPIALFSVGFQLRVADLKDHRPPLILGLLYKLLLGPLLIAFLYVFLLKASGKVIQVTLFEAAMPPMISAGILATENRLDPPLAVLLMGIGIPLSFLTVPLAWVLLQRI